MALHGQRGGILIPDLMVAFEVNIADVIARRGYGGTGQGAGVSLEIASPSAGRQDEERNVLGTRNTGCGSHFRFDPSGGEYHRQSLAGDVLIDGTSQGIAIEETHPFACSGAGVPSGFEHLLGIRAPAGGTRRRRGTWRPMTRQRNGLTPPRIGQPPARVQELEEEIHRRQQT